MDKWLKSKALAVAIEMTNNTKNGGKALELQSATIKIGEDQQTQTISTSDKSVSFTFQLSAGETRLQTYLTDSGGLTIGAYYVYASRI